MLYSGITPALTRLNGFPCGGKFRKKYPNAMPDDRHDATKRSAHVLSMIEAAMSLIFASATSLPKASVRSTYPQARIVPPANPPPGVRWP